MKPVKRWINKIKSERKIHKLCSDFNIDLVVLFGSYARGEEVGNGDVDIGIRYFERPEGAEEEISLIWSLEESLNQSNIDLVVINDANPLLLFEIASEGIPLYEREKGVFDQFVSYAVMRNNDAKKFYELEREYLEGVRERSKC